MQIIAFTVDTQSRLQPNLDVGLCMKPPGTVSVLKHGCWGSPPMAASGAPGVSIIPKTECVY